MRIRIVYHDGQTLDGDVDLRRITFRALEHMHEILELVFPKINFSRIRQIKAYVVDEHDRFAKILDAGIAKAKDGFVLDPPVPPFTAPIRRRHVEELIQEVFVHLMKEHG